MIEVVVTVCLIPVSNGSSGAYWRGVNSSRRTVDLYSLYMEGYPYYDHLFDVYDHQQCCPSINSLHHTRAFVLVIIKVIITIRIDNSYK